MMDVVQQNPANKRILYVLGRFPTLSETFIMNEIAGLLRIGLDVIPLSTGRRPEIPAEMHQIGVELAEKTIYMPAFAGMLDVLRRQVILRPKSVLRLLRLNLVLPCLPTTPKIKRFLKSVMVLEQVVELCPDHIHAHWTIPSDVAMMVAEVVSLPFSFTAHAHDIYEEAPLYEEQCPGLGLPYKISKSVFMTTCTEYNRRHLVSLCSPDLESRIHTIYHGVDTEHFHPGQRAGADHPIILSVGRIIAYKGFDRLVRLCLRLRQDGYEFKCLIVGDGSQREALIQEAADLGLMDTVIFLGPRPTEELREIYSQADIFVLAASLERGQHGLPNVLVEAASAGLAIVTTCLPPVGELIDNGRSGLVVDDNEDALYRGLKKLMDDPDLRLRLGDVAACVVRERFDFKQNIGKLSKLFETRISG